ncbi:DNA-processing protein DprA [Luteipulveratus halotolerans]|uniref:Uncharacterized protein n=1 Tax=Luteipulveratus halotolerans TaxID=1631356 RepID=A0A0L6CIZ1_9MICO|nr:DNA-processing protein DprA [Luteipulveratus halotolerans]KNX37575.1 hypothetical protein VV01_11120 [Luteipulveratus halotolerans]
MNADTAAQIAADPDKVARLTWARLVEPADDQAAPLLAEHGHVEALTRLRAGADRIGRAATGRLDEFDLQRELRATRLAGARLVFPGDDEWPAGLDDLARPPHCLWVRGRAHLADATRRSAAVVGARNASAYGTRVAADIASGLVERRFTVVSGAAFGIDAAAHRGALAAEGITIAALACGVDRAYPAIHARLLDQILLCGAVISEVPPGAAPIRTRFLARNRLIAAMALGTVVVEAGLRSGSLNTANHALECERPVGAVPGPVTSMASAGTHQLVRDHRAELVTDAAEVAELLGVIGEDLAPVRRGEHRPEDDLEGPARRLWEHLPTVRPGTVDRLAHTSGLTAPEVMAALGELNLRGMAERWSGGWRKVAPDTP